MNHHPHTGVLTRLRPSPIHGIGVFAICDIPRGTRIFPNDTNECVWVDKREIDALAMDENVRAFYRDFSILKDGKYGCPAGFDTLTAAWYLNSPQAGCEPNVRCDDNYDFFATRNITIGEELTLNYATLDNQCRFE